MSMATLPHRRVAVWLWLSVALVVFLPAHAAWADSGLQEVEAIAQELEAVELGEADWEQTRTAVEALFAEAYQVAATDDELDPQAQAHLRGLMQKAKGHINRLKQKVQQLENKAKAYARGARAKAKARLNRLKAWAKAMMGKAKAIERAQQAAAARAAAAEAEYESVRAYWEDARTQAKAYLGKLKGLYAKGKAYTNKAKAKARGLINKYHSKAKGWLNKGKAYVNKWKAKGMAYANKGKAYAGQLINKGKGFANKGKAWAQGQRSKADAMARSRSDDEVRRLVLEAEEATRRSID
ncbi:MAG: hypothetical protein JRI23_08245 [Deltaproteobacteria bacterium]|jgi:polyhydroxyalkanoate synthesis regulator phasin|nr:hypothetical protein [Deltaproteobacteria bacterium]MBW2531603.1 hypothetical protein [Deltaproteobacteria bacterium]